MNALSQRDLDDANASYESSINEVKIAEARVENAKIELGYTKVKAPITGIIGISKVQVGDYVRQVTLGTGINTISSLGEVRVRFPISENDYLKFVREYKKDPKKNNIQEIPVIQPSIRGSIFTSESP